MTRGYPKQSNLSLIAAAALLAAISLASSPASASRTTTCSVLTRPGRRIWIGPLPSRSASAVVSRRQFALRTSRSCTTRSSTTSRPVRTRIPATRPALLRHSIANWIDSAAAFTFLGILSDVSGLSWLAVCVLATGQWVLVLALGAILAAHPTRAIRRPYAVSWRARPSAIPR